MLYYWVQELGAIRSLQLGFNVHEPEKSTMKVPHAFRSNGGLKVVLTCPVPVHYVTPSQKRKKKVPTNKSEKKSTKKNYSPSTNLMTTSLRRKKSLKVTWLLSDQQAVL